MNELERRLLQIENELVRRKESDHLAKYNAGRKKHKKQLAFHRCRKRNRWVFGGNRTGKTECGAVECVYMARGIHPYRKNKKDVFGWVVSLSAQVQRDVAQKKLLYYIRPDWIEDIIMLSGRKDAPEYGVIDQIRIRNVFGGISVIGFRTCDQGREKFQGSSLDFVWFDEEPPKEIYEECRMRVLDRKGDLFGTMTPLKGLTFIYEEIYLNTSGSEEVWYEFMDWSDNPFLDRKETALLERTLSAEQLESRKSGKFRSGTGLVYPEFDENVNVIDPFDVPAEWQDTISIDPGLNNPLSAHWYAVDYDNRIYVIAEHYEAGRDVAYHAAKIREISAKLGWKTDAKGRVRALIDSAAEQRTLAAMKSVSELFYEHGILTDARVNKDMFSGIQRVKGLLAPVSGEPRLYIFRTCVNMIRELKSYWWGEGDRPVKRDDHAMDELRYYAMSKPENKPPVTVSETAKAKEKLIRKRKLSRYEGVYH